MEASSRAESAGSEPIAVIGIGCRFAGGVTCPETLWLLLQEGRDGVVPIPAERWNASNWYDPDRHHPGTMNFMQAGFLQDRIDLFDPAFFGIAPREAQMMDPQQRLFLEVAFEALEDAGIRSDALAQTRTGIFAGVYNGNYTMMARGAPDAGAINGWSATGGHASIVAGRLAYFLGTTGPALAVDTACSSSLVAVHLALQSLRSGECEMALVGGVHLLTAPEPLVASTKLGATAADGRCKVFDAAADGFGHGEGAGIVVLKRLSDATAAGDRIIAVIRGSAVNQDGRSNSLTAPNGPSQTQVIARALADAGVAPSQVSYVEAHGTATPLGDPIEVEAIGEALCGQRDRPLVIGSVKSNLGHTEAAAGIAGLIKAVLVAERGVATPQAGFHELNPEIAALDLPIAIPQAPTVLDGIGGRRIVGVSAFGFSGTNAHVVVEAHFNAEEPAGADVASVFAVSARSEAGHERAIERWSDYLAKTREDPRAIALTSTAGRRHWSRRVAVAAATAEEAARALAVAPRCEAKSAPRVAFLFTGQGSQHCGMCKRLFETEPLFRHALDRMAAVLDEELGIDSLSLMFGDEPIDRTDFAQPLIVAAELALASFWREIGVEPVAVMGHSVGEFAAAAVAGALSEGDALRLAVARGRAMQALPPGGGMMALFGDPESIMPFMERAGGILAIAAVNGASSVVVAGETAALDRLRALLEADGQDCRPLAVSHAFHSPLIDPALPALREAAERIGTGRTVIPLISNVTGAALKQIDADYWIEHARRPVRFADGVRALETLKIDVFLEIGPDATLTSLAGMTAPGTARVPSLRRGRADDRVLAEAMAALHCAGADLAWRKTAGGQLPPVRAPLVQFERSRHWLETPVGTARPKSPPPKSTRSERLRSEPESEKGSPLVYDFYDELTVLSQNYADTVGDATHEEGHLTFGLLPRNETGFSWVRALFEKDRDPQGHHRLRQTQSALKEALFAEIDFTRIRTIFDYGCGHAADLASLVLAHPHLKGRGYTISGGQVDVGRRRLAALGIADRVDVDRNDSSKTPFPRENDLIFGVEVTGLIADKEGLFANVADGLAEGGLLVIADFIATRDAIANPDTHSYTPVAREWAELLGRHKLRIVRAVDASEPVANWLDDLEFEANVDSVVARYGLSALTKRHLLSNGNIGRALRADLMRYLLLRAIASPYETVEAVTAANLAAFDEARPLVVEADRFAGPGWFYDIAEQPAKLHPVQEPGALRAAIADATAQEQRALAAFPSVGQTMDDLARRYIVAAFRSLGARNLDDLPQLAIAPANRRLVEHLAEQLRDGGVYTLDEPGDVAEFHRKARLAHPEAEAELVLLERCGSQLADALAGRADPLELLFPKGDARDAEALYERSPFSSALQRMAGAVAAALRRDEPLRVIEIGGGTGATTAHVRNQLPEGSQYLFTDISAALVARARERFAGEGVETAQYDVERPAAALNIAVGSFDVAVAANVLHATADLSGTLANVRELIAPGGLLMLIENAGPFLWGDITFGLTPGMWAFPPGERRHALIDPQEWRRELAVAGFEAIEIVDPGHSGLHGISRQCLILARRSSRRRFGLAGDTAGKGTDIADLLRSAGHDADVLSLDRGLPEGLTDILHLAGLDEARPAQDILKSAHALVLQAASEAPAARIALLSSGGTGAACLAGFGRGVAVELPESLCRTITLDANRSLSAQGSELVAAIARGGADIRIGEAGATSPQLVARAAPEVDQPSIDPDASYLVTGAYGGLGPHLVRWLHGRGARRFVLAGRNQPSEEARGLLDGIDAHFEIADVSDPAAVERLVVRASSIAPLKGVFHAAGALADGALMRQDGEGIILPLGAKLDGAIALDHATRDIPLDHFVLFSSAAGLLAPFGQANHAAAATALDALAHARRGRGLPALCVDWGAFAEAGAAMRSGIEAKVSDSGLSFMGLEPAFEALGRAMSANLAQVAILAADWRQYRQRYPRGGVPFLLEGVCRFDDETEVGSNKTAQSPAAGLRGVPSKTGSRDWRDLLASAPQGHRFDRLCDVIRTEAARILRLPEAELDDLKPLREAGLDSLMSIEFRNVLSEAASSRLGATIVFDHPSVRALATHLAETAFDNLFEREPESAALPDDLDGLDAEALAALLASELGDDGRV